MDSHTNIAYERFIVTTVKKGFLPMYGCNFQDPISQRMDNEYHISIHTDLGLLLTSESQSDRLHKATIYYELNTTKSDQDSATIDRILDILKEASHTSCNVNGETIFTVKYDATNDFISHFNRLSSKGISLNNPWRHLDKHNIDIIQFDEDRLKMSEYHRNDKWIAEMPDAVKYLIGYKN